MKNLIIYLVLILFTNNIDSCPECPPPPKAKVGYVAFIIPEDGEWFEVPNDLVVIDSVKYKKWYYDINKKFDMNVKKMYSPINK